MRETDKSHTSPLRRTFPRARAAVIAAVVAVPIGVGAIGLLPAGVAQAAAGLSVTRVSGTDRFATAGAIADAGWQSALPAGSTLVLASGENYPDAVGGAAAAGHLDTPLLLTAHATLSSAAAAEISRLRPATVALLGGTAAIADSVVSQVKALGPNVVRWQGADRYGTAAAVSQATYPNGATNVYLAAGTEFPDALAGSALAAVAGGPLLLTDPNSLPPATATELARLHPAAIVVLGGTSAVSASVATAAVTAVGGAQLSRIQGANRYQTADAVASVLVQVHGGSSASNGIVVATGLSFADALAGAAWAGATDRPMLLVPGTYVASQTWQAIQTLNARSAVVIGGAGAVADRVLTGLQSGNPPTSG